MTYVITQNCCNDAACADVCPVDAIHPTPGEPGYATTEMLYIDPGACIDCGACLEACPVDAVHPADELPDPLTRYIEINAGYYRAKPAPASPIALRVEPKPVSSTAKPLRVAIVGSGPSGFYAAAHLLATSAALVEVSMFERLATPFGLVRAGVAPDHPRTKQVTDLFRWTAAHPGFHTYLNVEIGRHLDHAELLEHHHAVIYTVGASDDRRLDIPGEDLPGSHPATDFVAWYNGHPDYANHTFDLNNKRAVVIGNGNVALDVTRLLLMDADSLARTDIADHALAALAVSTIEEVVVIGRRGPAQAAYTTPELLALGDLDGIDVVVDPRDMPPSDEPTTFTAYLKSRVLGELTAAPRRGKKRIVLRFLNTPIDILGTDHVEGLELARNRIVRDQAGALVAEPTGETEKIDTGLVLRAIGYRGRPVAGLPFDEHSGTLPNDRGRVVDPHTGQPLPGVYTAGWIKRGPTGVIGTNKPCAAETVEALLEDHAAGRLPGITTTADELADLVRHRQPRRVDRHHWQRIDEHEIARGRSSGRPRVKLTDAEALLRVASGRAPTWPG